MSLSKEANVTPNNIAEVGDGSDQSLSDSWTVLDSSHFKDDGDLSDAESVEVLREELPSEDSDTEQNVCETPVSDSSTVIASPHNCDEAAPALAEAAEARAGGMAGGMAACQSQSDDSESLATENMDDTTSAVPPNPQEKHPRYLFNGVPIEVVGEPFSTWLLQIAIYSLFLDLILLCYFGMSSLAGMIEIPTPHYLKPSKSYQPFEMDPLSLQFSHVLAEWKKRPLEDHSLDRHVLKTLLLYYGGSPELSAHLHTLTEKVQKHNDLIKRLGKEHDRKELQHHRMVTSAHIAHSIACILGKRDGNRVVPAELLMNLTKDERGEFAPEPGFLLHDWQLPQYFRANDTYYRIDVKSSFSPILNLNWEPDSSKWRKYYPWKIKMANEKKGLGESEVHVEKGSDSELDGEETERSPLDPISSADLTDEESSGSVVEHSEESIEDLDHFIFGESESTEESIAHLFEFLNVEDRPASGYKNRFSGWGNSMGNPGEPLIKDRLNILYDELPLGEQNEHVKASYESFGENSKSNHLNSMFEEITSDEPEDDEILYDSVDDFSKVERNDFYRMPLKESPGKDRYTGWYIETPKTELVQEEKSKEYKKVLGAVNESIGEKQKKAEKEEEVLKKALDLFNDYVGEKQKKAEKDEVIFKKVWDMVNESIGEKQQKAEKDEEMFKKILNLVHDSKKQKRAGKENNHEGWYMETLGNEPLTEERVEIKKHLDTVNFVSGKEKEAKKGMKENGGDKQKLKSDKYDTDNTKFKNKQKKKGTRGKSGVDIGVPKGKKNTKKKSNKKDRYEGDGIQSDLHLKSEDVYRPIRNNRRNRFMEERGGDWNTRMAEGREKLRALHKKEDDQIWVFERARARRDMREEIFSE